LGGLPCESGGLRGRKAGFTFRPPSKSIGCKQSGDKVTRATDRLHIGQAWSFRLRHYPALLHNKVAAALDEQEAGAVAMYMGKSGKFWSILPFRKKEASRVERMRSFFVS
jgi:hypothetical protein